MSELADPEIHPLLTQAVAHLNQGAFPPAEALLNQALAAQPESCDALFVYGQMRRLQNRFGEADDYYRKALAIDPERADIHFHLGQLRIQTGRVAEAIASQREALRLKPNFASAQLELGAALSRAGDLPGAEAAYRAALRLQPNLVSAKQALSGILIMQRKPKEAEAVIRSGLMQAQNDPRWFAALEHNLAIAVSEQHRHEEALMLFDDVQAMAPSLPRLDYNRANTLQSLGRNEDAEASYRKALLNDPLDLRAHRSLSQLLYRMGRDDFLASYDEAMRSHGDNAPLAAEKGYYLLLMERYEEAREAYARAVAAAPSEGVGRSGLAAALTGLARYDEAIREYEHLLHAYPDHVDVRCGFAECLSRAGDAKKALAAAEEAIARDPHHQLAIALKATALRQMGEAEKAGFDDCDALVQVFDLEPPEGFSDMESFNRELDAYLTGLHHDTQEHINQTSRRGTKTSGTLFGAGHELVDKLQVRIAEAVAAYIERMSDDEAHPLFSRRANGFGYWGSWSTRLSDCGFHVNHVHPRGWISSAYYVALPDVVGDETEKQGWIKFGEPFFDAGLKDPIRRTVQPAPGRLVLFPSYMWHGTVPFHAQQTRTTIAFDATPE